MDAIVPGVSRAADTARLIASLDAAIPGMQARAAATDADGAFPEEDIAELAAIGALVAPLPHDSGGLGLGTEPEGGPGLLAVLRRIGRGNLAIGRVYEGHVNALRLLARFGTPGQRAQAAADAQAGHLFALWNTEPADDPARLSGPPDAPEITGSKTLASAAGFTTRPVVTAMREGEAERRLAVLDIPRGERADLSGWTAHGMRASATGRVRLTGLPITGTSVFGEPGDYVRQPDFAAGAWRTSAVTLGGLDALMALYRTHLLKTARGDDPIQRARLGQAVMAQETASLWMERAAHIAEGRRGDPAETVAYVNLARLAVEQACLDVMQLAQRSIGLAAFIRPNPVERLLRDLATYLRQPAPDAALAEAASHFLRNDLPAACA